MTDEATWWDGLPAQARRCVVRVLDPGRRPVWYVELIGRERPAIEVVVPVGVSPMAAGSAGQRLYIDDDRGWGWRKVTLMRGARGVVCGIYHRVEVVDYFE